MNTLSNYSRGRTLGLVFTATLWLVLAATTQADDAVPLSFKVIAIAGSARYSNTNTARGSWTALRVGDELRAVSALQTDSKGSNTADVELIGPDGRSWGKIRMFSNCVLKPLRLDLKKSGSSQATDVRLDVPMGQIRVSVDGGSDYVFALNEARITPALSVAARKEMVFVFASPGSLTVLNGLVTASFGLGPEKLVRAGEQLRHDASEVTKLPPEAPEFNSGNEH
jgi:hypothetical protein